MKTRRDGKRPYQETRKDSPMHLISIDPRALQENPNKARRSKSSAQADAVLLASIKAVGIVQPPVVSTASDGGNGFVIDAGHRRVAQAIEAELPEILVLVDDADHGDAPSARSSKTWPVNR